MQAGTLRIDNLSSQFRNWRYRELALMLSIVAVCLPLAFRFLIHEQYNLLGAVLSFTVLFTIGLFEKRAAIALTFAYLLLIGDLRRIGEMAYGTPRLDLLIAVGLAMTLFLATPLLIRIRLDSPLSKVVFALMCLMVLEIFNPLQGSIASSLSGGVLFYIVPILWFWIGQRYGTDSMIQTVLFKVVVPLACLAALLGLYQTFVGFLPWEQAWINAVIKKLAALGIGGSHVRPFGFAVNGADYAYLLAIGCACCTGAWFAGRRVYALVLILLFPVLLLASVRSVLVKLVFATALQWALLSDKGNAWVLRVAVFLIVAAGAISLSSSQVANVGGGNPNKASTAQLLLSHEAGLFNNPQHSTLSGHGTMVVDALMRGITNPIGYGLGSSTIGGSKVGEQSDVVGSSEFDVTDAFTSMGLFGGLLYIVWLAIVFLWIVRLVRHDRSVIAASLAGVVFCSLGSWTGGPGGYSLAPIYSFLIGSLALESRKPIVDPSSSRALSEVVPTQRSAGALTA